MAKKKARKGKKSAARPLAARRRGKAKLKRPKAETKAPAPRGRARPTATPAPAKPAAPPPKKPPGPADRLPAAALKPRGIAHGPGVQLEVGRQLLYVSRARIERLPWEPGEVTNHVEIALRELGRGKVEMPAEVFLCPQREALLTAAPAMVPNVLACGVRWFSSFPNNLRAQLPQVSAVVVLSDPHTGFPIAVMDGSWLTARRGPAVSAVAARLLARPESAACGIVGGGVQGRGHIPALVGALPELRNIKIFDIRHAQAVKASKGWRGKLGRRIKIEPVDTVDQAVRGADVVVSATAITDKPEPSVSADLIKSGALVLPLDLDAVFEPAVFARADRFYVDSMDDLQALRDQGFFKKGLPANLTGQLGQVVTEKVSGRSADAERIVCLNVGPGCVDIVLARAIYDKACRFGIGQVLDL